MEIVPDTRVFNFPQEEKIFPLFPHHIRRLEFPFMIDAKIFTTCSPVVSPLVYDSLICSPRFLSLRFVLLSAFAVPRSSILHCQLAMTVPRRNISYSCCRVMASSPLASVHTERIR